jgi:hypothetical protein
MVQLKVTVTGASHQLLFDFGILLDSFAVMWAGVSDATEATGVAFAWPVEAVRSRTSAKIAGQNRRKANTGEDILVPRLIVWPAADLRSATLAIPRRAEPGLAPSANAFRS